MLISDLETDGLLDVVSVIHCVHMFDTEQPELGIQRYNDHNYKSAGSVAEGVQRLGESTDVIFHNGVGYDYLVLDKLYPGWDVSKPNRWDTIVMTRVIYTELKALDFACREKGYWRIGGETNDCPEKMGGIIGSHSLAAWGHRLGEHKGEYRPDEGHDTKWQVWNEEMDDYCVQDIVVTRKLWELIEGKQYSQVCFDLEHDFAVLMDRQERWGFKLNKKKADVLHEKLMLRKLEVFRYPCNIH